MSFALRKLRYFRWAAAIIDIVSFVRRESDVCVRRMSGKDAIEFD